MGSNAEYHDPDYPVAGTSTGGKTEPHSSGDERVRRFKSIVKSEIASELRIKENEVLQFDERLQMSRRLLHQLRYSVISQYYHAKSIYLSESHVERELATHVDPLAKAEVSKIVRNVQRRIHPSVKKLLGKKEVDIEEIFKFRSPRQKTRKDYLAMAQAKNVTTVEEDCKSMRPGAESRLQDPTAAPDVTQESTRPKKVPRYVEPTIDRSIVTLDEATRNKQKTRYRIIIGNTSKYVPPASKADKSTHKWLLYVRGPPHRPELGALVTRVTARLHDTYAPHHLVNIESPPFHISRRGWGEFPAKIELHFALPTHNKPSTVYHTIKLDRRYTGMQTLGAETIVDVWLYSTEEMLKYEYKEPPASTANSLLDKPQDPPKSENWLDFLNADCKSTNSPEDRISDLDDRKIKQEPDDDFMTNDDTKMDVSDFENYGSVKVKQEYDSDKELMEINDYMASAYNEFADDDIVIKKESAKSENEDKRDRYENVDNIKKNIEKRVFKYIDPNTRKIFYLELDRDIDLNKVQEIVFHPENQKSKKELTPPKCQNGVSRAPKKSISLLKPEVKNQLKSEIKETKTKSSTHIENDHCYSANAFRDVTFDMSTAYCQTSAVAKEPPEIVEKVSEISQHLTEVARLDDTRMAVNFLLRNIPLVNDMAEHPSYLQLFPFAVTSLEKYWSLDYVKRRNMEWSRARLIFNILSKHFKHKNNIWRTKQILLFSRLHGYQPVKPSDELRSSWNDTDGQSDVTSRDHLTMFDEESFKADDELTTRMSDDPTCDLTVSDDEIDVLGDDETATAKVKRSPVKDLTTLEILDDRERSQCLFIEKKCSEIGFELKNEDIGYGYSCSAVHKVMLVAVKCFASELIRNALATKTLAEQAAIQRKSGPRIWEGQSDGRRALQPSDVCAALEDRFSVLTARHLAAPAHKHELL